MALGQNRADPWSGLREVTNRDRSNSGVRSEGGASRNTAPTRVASVGGWNFGGGGAQSYDPWSGLRSTNRPVTPAFAGPRTPNVHSRNMALYRNAIAGIESAGWGTRDYQAIGPRNATLGRPLGRYQMMEGNLPRWSQQAVGRTVTPNEFLSSPDLQNRIFDHKFGGYIDRFGTPAKAAQAWFGGPGSVGKLDRKDVLGTSVGKYSKMFTANLKKEIKNTPNTVETTARSVRDVGVPGAMAGVEDVGGMGRAPQRTPMQAIGRGLSAAGTAIAGEADAGRGGLLAGETGGFEQMGSLAVPPVGVSGGVGAVARGAASVDLSGIDMGSTAANAGLRAGSGASMAAAGGATMRDMFAGSWIGRTQMDDATLMEVIFGSPFTPTGSRDRNSGGRKKKLILKNERYGLL